MRVPRTSIVPKTTAAPPAPARPQVLSSGPVLGSSDSVGAGGYSVTEVLAVCVSSGVGVEADGDADSEAVGVGELVVSDSDGLGVADDELSLGEALSLGDSIGVADVSEGLGAADESSGDGLQSGLLYSLEYGAGLFSCADAAPGINKTTLLAASAEDAKTVDRTYGLLSTSCDITNSLKLEVTIILLNANFYKLSAYSQRNTRKAIK